MFPISSDNEHSTVNKFNVVNNTLECNQLDSIDCTIKYSYLLLCLSVHIHEYFLQCVVSFLFQKLVP